MRSLEAGLSQTSGESELLHPCVRTHGGHAESIAPHWVEFTSVVAP